MNHCDTCRFRTALRGGRINCQNQNAAPRTESYAGSGAHPLKFDPDIVLACDGWEDDLTGCFPPAEVSLSQPLAQSDSF